MGVLVRHNSSQVTLSLKFTLVLKLCYHLNHVRIEKRIVMRGVIPRDCNIIDVGIDT